MGYDPMASGPTPGHPAPTPQVPNSAEHSLRKAISSRIRKILNRVAEPLINAYPWIGALLAVGCVIVGFFQTLIFTAAIVTSIGALAVLLGSILQATAAFMSLTESSDTSHSDIWSMFHSFGRSLAIALLQAHGWVLILGGSTLLLAGAIMAAIAVA
jgi:hypothetical protein